ncbi:MAG: acetoacetate decarboxylase family protein [Proteobacteria bacterium]|nr:acetoacetate decarboxylase family protein [Pseudomonadota bacterium]
MPRAPTARHLQDQMPPAVDLPRAGKRPARGRWSVALLAALGLADCAPLAPGFYDAATIDDPNLPSCMWTRRFSPPIVYQESDFIRAFFEPVNLAAYRQAIPAPFAMPPRPLVRVSVLHYYEMENGPIYHESEVSVLALHEGKPGWFVLTMPVTDGDACAGGRNALGTPKVMRRITLERGADQHVGTSYARGGRTPEFTLTVAFGEPGAAAREVLRFVSPFPDLYILRGSVLKLGGGRGSIETLETAAPGVWKIRLGTARLEAGGDPESVLQRLGVGSPLVAYWGRLRFRFSITPQ